MLHEINVENRASKIKIVKTKVYKDLRIQEFKSIYLQHHSSINIIIVHRLLMFTRAVVHDAMKL